MAETRVAETIDALVTTFTTALAPVTIEDGPLSTDDPLQKVVTVGWDGDPEGDYDSTVDWQQSWAGLGAFRRDETFGIVCSLSVWSGDDRAVKTRRDDAFALLASVGSALRANPGLGLSQPFVAELAYGQLFQTPSRARITFTVVISHARI